MPARTPDARFGSAVGVLADGADVVGYLHERHIVQHWTVNAIAADRA